MARPNPQADTTIQVRNGRVGLYYALGGACLLALGSLGWPWGDDSHLAGHGPRLVMALGYFVFGAVVYRKLDGHLAFSSRVLLAPIIAGHCFPSSTIGGSAATGTKSCPVCGLAAG